MTEVSTLSSPSKPQVALVTGASSGIGRAIARTLAQTGYQVVLCARRRDRLDALKGELTEAGAEVLVQPADLRQEAEILALFDQIRQVWGGVDVLVNNAGLGRKAPLMSGETEPWREMGEYISVMTRRRTLS